MLKCLSIRNIYCGFFFFLALWANTLQAQVLLDGRFYTTEVSTGSPGYYSSMGQYTRPHSTTTGFGDYGLLQAYVSNTSTKLTIGVRGTLEPNTTGAPIGNVFQVYLDLPNSSGVPLGAALPYTTTGTTSFDGMAGTRMDMPTDYGLALGYNPSGVLTAQYADYTQGSNAVAGNLGNLGTSGMVGTFFSAAAQSRFYGARMAYVAPSPALLSYNANQGWEMELDLARLGVSPGQQVRVFVLYGSGDSGYVSTDFIPQSGTTINPGNSPNFANYAATQAYLYTLTGATAPTTYCTTGLGGGSCDITSVQVPGAGFASTVSNCPGVSSNNYSTYSSSAVVQPGRGYNVSVTSSSTMSVSAWADWNQDGIFSSSEYVQVSPGTSAGVPASATMYVPTGAALGNTIFRVRTRVAGATNTATDACSVFGSGETRDYTITVGCALAAPTVSGDGSYCVGQVVQLSASGIAGGASYQWSGPNGYTSFSSAPAFYATVNGSGTYVLTVTSGGCSVVSRAVQVNVTAAPVPTVTAGSNCGPGVVTLGASGATAGGSYRWYNSSSSPTVLGTGSSFNTAYLGNSTYYYVSTVNAAGCESSRSFVLATISNVPVPNLAANGPTSFCQGGNVLLTGSGSPTGSYQYYRNGVAITGPTSSSYLATTGGTYTVSATNSAGCTGTSGPLTVTVSPGTSAAFAYGTNTYCQSGANPAPVVTGTAGGTFTTTGSGLNLNPSNGTINLSQSQPGTYTITYSVAANCSSVSSTTLTISQAAQATFAYAATSYCASGSAVLPVLAAGSSAGSFSATPAGLALSASTGAVDLAASQPGTYTITNAIAAGSGCTPTSATATLGVSALPAATLVAGGPLTFCQGGAVVLTAPAGTGYSYQFLRNWAAISGANSATYSATTAGDYAVAVTNAAGCTATTPAVVSVVVNPITTATFAYTGGTYCQGSGATPTPSVSGTTGGAFSSTSGLNINAATGTIDVSQSQPGTYRVTYAVAGPCPSSGTATVVITPPASASFAYTAPSFCAATAATAAATLASGATAGVFTASPAGLSLSASTGAVDLATSQPGTYIINNAVAAANGCNATSGTTVLIINAAPVAPTVSVVRGGSTTTLTSSASTGNQWYLNGLPIAGATADTYVANGTAQVGTYTVVVTNANGCASAPSGPTIVTGTARAAGSAVQLYPNPTSDGRFTLELSGYPQAVEVLVLNALGQSVLHLAVPARANGSLRQVVDLHGQASGIYLLQTRSAGFTDSRRVVLN